MSLQFTPATSDGWVLLSTEQRMLLVAVQPNAALVDAAWTGLGAPAGFQRVLDILTKDGLAATPDFALLDWTGEPNSVRVILRGAITLQTTGSEPITLTATAVSTWVEQSITGVDGVGLAISGAAASDASLPLVAGAAIAAAVRLTLSGEPTPVPSPAPTPAPAQAPARSAVVTTPAIPLVDIEATVTDSRSEATPVPASAVPAPADVAAPVDAAVDAAVEATVYRTVTPEGAAEPDAAESDGDHDGHTVLTSDIAKLRGKRATPPTQAPEPADDGPSRPVVLAFSTGQRAVLDQPVLVGRSPSVSQVSGGRMPTIVTVGGVEQDISRNHAQVSLEGGTVVVTDLHSRNGTSVVLPGKSAQKLRAGEPTAVIAGTVIDLGGGITISVEAE